MLSIQPCGSDEASNDQSGESSHPCPCHPSPPWSQHSPPGDSPLSRAGVLLRLSDGSVLSADRVVCCVGMGSPRIPSWAQSHRLPSPTPSTPATHDSHVVFANRSKNADVSASSTDRRLPVTLPQPAPTATTLPLPPPGPPTTTTTKHKNKNPTGTALSTAPLPPLPILHSSELLRLGMAPEALFKHRRVVVVGGGLTAAHLVLLAHKYVILLFCSHRGFSFEGVVIIEASIDIDQRRRLGVYHHVRLAPAEAPTDQQCVFCSFF